MDPSRPPPVDLLSSFPEHLQDEILSRLDVRDAVRTSALSRAWRRRWETIPGLALSIPDGTPPSAVDRVLLRYAGPSVSRFSMYVDGNDEASASHLADWLIALSRRGVESITLDNAYIGGPFFTVHSSIFSCHRLVSLTLVECCIPPLPQHSGGFTGFPVLHDMHLASVVFLDDGETQLPAIIRASPMLRILVLEGLDIDCVIEAPALHTLSLFDSMDCRFGELPCLRYGCFNLPLDFQSGPAGFVEFLAVFSHVQELIITLGPERFHFKMDATVFTFPNLKSMELSIDFDDTDNILFMFFLLRSSPNIAKLKIMHRRPKTVADQMKFLNAQWTDGMCANLQVVEITSVMGCLPLSFMKLILSKASLLRTLSVDKCPVSQDDPLNELLNCIRASPQAQVQFKD